MGGCFRKSCRLWGVVSEKVVDCGGCYAPGFLENNFALLANKKVLVQQTKKREKHSPS